MVDVKSTKREQRAGRWERKENRNEKERWIFKRENGTGTETVKREMDMKRDIDRGTTTYVEERVDTR